MFSLFNKVAVITGGGSGIGLATARRFAGATVVIANRSDSSALTRSFGASYVRTDVGNEQDVAHLTSWTVGEYDCIDVLVNTAAFAQISPTVTDWTTETLNEHPQPNVLGAAYGMKHAAPHMPRGGWLAGPSIAAFERLAGAPAD